eukprot:jgi/Chlat1/5473/Chrsp36S05454
MAGVARGSSQQAATGFNVPASPLVRAAALRWEGNAKLQLVDSFTAISLKLSKLESATRLYNQAAAELLTAPKDCPLYADEHASVQKNLGVAHWKQAEVYIGMKEATSAIYHLKTSISSFIAAARDRTDKFSTQSYEWLVSLQLQVASITNKAASLLTDWSQTAKLKALHQLTVALQHTCFRKAAAVACRTYARQLFYAAVTTLAEGSLRTCLSYIAECHRPIECWQQVGDEGDAVEEQRGDIYLLRCTAESMRARQQADIMVEAALNGEDDLNVDMLWQAIDKYKEASLLTREHDVENEAIALSRLGRVFMKVLKLEERGNKYCVQAIQLAHAQQPRNLCDQAWLVECTELTKEYRQRKLAHEAEEQAKQRAPILEELQAVLDVIRAKSQESGVALLRHIYQVHSPKNTNQKIGSLEPESMKKTMQSAIIHYHPDKNLAFGKQWEVLCEEITKELTGKYEYLK